jgi:Lar family restriction alleviation protein
MKTPDLKPCPFCGGKASLFRFKQPDGSITYEVDCENDGCECSACTAMHDTPEEAAAVWNKRPVKADDYDEKSFSGLIEEE